jgi:pimeloyl-ACP methyl ester carboxylesterase
LSEAPSDPQPSAVGAIADDVVALVEDWAGRPMPTQLSVPTLILVGEQEDVEREAEAAAAAMPNGEAVYMSGRGHVGVSPGAPKESAERVLPFLRRTTAELRLTS